ncbi:MAG TPA: hypothetical protein PL182_09605 [Pseudobdellovibrionaceae bacterium]|nr:hypothetical protein [Pseudobdellovibrionaceae bacterium]
MRRIEEALDQGFEVRSFLMTSLNRASFRLFSKVIRATTEIRPGTSPKDTMSDSISGVHDGDELAFFKIQGNIPKSLLAFESLFEGRNLIHPPTSAESVPSLNFPSYNRGVIARGGNSTLIGTFKDRGPCRVTTALVQGKRSRP